jgi:hypothetical protein
LASIFINYRRKDSEYAVGWIDEHLEKQFGREQVFRDIDLIPLGVDFPQHLKERLDRCDVFLAVIGRDWLHIKKDGKKRALDDPDDFVRIEIEVALGRGIPVIPVLVQGARVPQKSDLPPTLQDLSSRNAVEVRADHDFRNDVRRLIGKIESHLKAAEEARRQAPGRPDTSDPMQLVAFVKSRYSQRLGGVNDVALLTIIHDLESNENGAAKRAIDRLNSLLGMSFNEAELWANNIHQSIAEFKNLAPEEGQK